MSERLGSLKIDEIKDQHKNESEERPRTFATKNSKNSKKQPFLSVQKAEEFLVVNDFETFDQQEFRILIQSANLICRYENKVHNPDHIAWNRHINSYVVSTADFLFVY